ncbi:hypothetical protein ACH5RR_035675 [Cinchona calisaya]|uniref:Trichome birefringence-like N-terminal domain-containing protein n=1 Tax=Cinchona calisaya TaxID=153742 RepID=A0ABD2Y2H4_9GENT
MGTIKALKDHESHSLLKTLLPWSLSALLPIALIRLYFYPLPFLLSQSNQIHTERRTINTDSSSHSQVEIACDYSNGKWVRDKLGPLYNGTKCDTIKDGQNCMKHGRPDKDYLYWRWKPKGCTLPRFEPLTFLEYLRNKSLAFVGDSVARNQLESLLCMVATVSTPNLVYTNGEDNKFRKWHFPSHNVSVSMFWSPFLVQGIEKKSDVNNDITQNYNTLYLDSVDEKWAGEISHLDMIVLSVGHWFLHRAIFHYGDLVLGCHYRSDQNCTEIGFYDVYGKAYKTALNAIIDRGGPSGKAIDAIVTTFSPAHFEGEWDKFGACPKTKPYKGNEKKLEEMDAEMRNVGIKEVVAAKRKANTKFGNLRFEYVDVSRLSLLRPDGHPGPYLYPFPFANGIADRVQNDCVHWCLPGPIDTWNEILLEVVKRRDGQYRRK